MSVNCLVGELSRFLLLLGSSVKDDQIDPVEMSTKVARSTVQQIKPLLSSNKEDAKERVLKLYKAWYRQIPIMSKFILVECH